MTLACEVSVHVYVKLVLQFPSLPLLITLHAFSPFFCSWTPCGKSLIDIDPSWGNLVNILSLASNLGNLYPVS